MPSENCTKDIHLNVINRLGSVEHYYHFLLGFLVPLIVWDTRERKCKSNKVYIRSCGIMDQLLVDAGIVGLEFVDKVVHEDQSSKTSLFSECSFVDKLGYDTSKYYSYADFSAASQILNKSLANEILAYLGEFDAGISAEEPVIVMIDRAPSDPFYLSEACENEGSGASRRSISNFEELSLQVSLNYKNVMSVTLEGRPLAYQIALFKSAGIVIAQHGAAMANLIWCSPGTSLIEIYPSDLRRDIKRGDFFRNLAHCMNLNYRRLKQKSSHSCVDSDLLLRLIGATIKNKQSYFEKLTSRAAYYFQSFGI